MLAHALENYVLPIRVSPPNIEISLLDGAPRTLPNDLRARLSEWTGTSWMVAVTDGDGEATVAERRKAREAEAAAAKARAIAEMEKHPKVQELLLHFPGAKITDVRDLPPEDEDDG